MQQLEQLKLVGTDIQPQCIPEIDECAKALEAELVSEMASKKKQ